MRDLLALSLLLQRNNIIEGQFSLALVEVTCTKFNAFLHTFTYFKDEYQSDTIGFILLLHARNVVQQSCDFFRLFFTEFTGGNALVLNCSPGHPLWADIGIERTRLRKQSRFV
jgi:hypothetical protein